MRHSTSKARAPLALTALLATLALTAGCGDGRTVSTDKPGNSEQKQTRFQQRADRIEQTWPKTERTQGKSESMLPAESARPDGDPDSATTLAVTVGHSACDAGHGAHVAERGDLVVVAGWSRPKDEKDNDMCTGQLATDRVDVPLEEPLGDRTVVDAVTGRELPAKK